ncbi:MAG: 4Fe-4S binding protein [Chitinivibrionales bacterium]|nr:4Fe-4S binding protein [Chitinivibrionales bacterium]
METQNRLTQKCCELCWHSLEKPCNQFVECISGAPLCHTSHTCTEHRAQARKAAAKQSLQRPIVSIGMGSCGLGAGAAKTAEAIRAYCSRNDKAVDIIEVGCIGLCAVEPLVDVQLPGRTRVSFQTVTTQSVTEIFDDMFKGVVNKKYVLGQINDPAMQPFDGVLPLSEHPFFKPQTRLVLKNCGIIDPSSLDDYLLTGGYKAFARVLKSYTPPELCDIVEKSGLRGRGGGGFLTGKKWKFALTTPSDQKYFICNADEGDPGAFMDRAVIEGDPHRLIEGLAIGAYAIGATKAYVYIRAEYPLAIVRLKEALRQAKENGILGYNIFDSGFNLSIIIKEGAGAFVCGEETALMHSIEGKRGMPRVRPPYPAVSGLFKHPTVINNVETLANLPAIVGDGWERFAGLGTANSKGTKVFALSGKVVNTGLVEIEMGKTMHDIIFTIGGGIPDNKKFKAVQIGGPSGGCIPDSQIMIQIDYESLKKVGAMMGSGGLVVMDEDNCMVDVAKFFMEFIQRESCGKCIPCREGTRRMLEILQAITRSAKNEKDTDALDRFKGVTKLEELARVIKDTSLCGLGQTAPNPILTSLRWFKEEYDAHIYQRRCPAGACKQLVRYEIDTQACKGCTLCAKKCPTDAIMGAAKSPHYIIADKCVACGTCLAVCKFKAVIKS